MSKHEALTPSLTRNASSINSYYIQVRHLHSLKCMQLAVLNPVLRWKPVSVFAR